MSGPDHPATKEAAEILGKLLAEEIQKKKISRRLACGPRLFENEHRQSHNDSGDLLDPLIDLPQVGFGELHSLERTITARDSFTFRKHAG